MKFTILSIRLAAILSYGYRCWRPNRSYLTVALSVALGGKHRSRILQNKAGRLLPLAQKCPVSPSHAGKRKNMTVKQTVEVTNKLSMHARPAMKLSNWMQVLTPRCYYAMTKAPKRKQNSVIALNARLRQGRPDRNAKHRPARS